MPRGLGVGGFVAAILVNHLAQSGWSGPRTLGCHVSPPQGDTENALGSSPLPLSYQTTPFCPHPGPLGLGGQKAQDRPLPHGTEDRAMPSSALSTWEMDRATNPCGILSLLQPLQRQNLVPVFGCRCSSLLGKNQSWGGESKGEKNLPLKLS